MIVTTLSEKSNKITNYERDENVAGDGGRGQKDWEGKRLRRWKQIERNVYKMCWKLYT